MIGTYLPHPAKGAPRFKLGNLSVKPERWAHYAWEAAQQAAMVRRLGARTHKPKAHNG